MAITLNHTIVPARDKTAAAKFFADIFGLKRGRTGYFAPVRINKSLTLLFDDDNKFKSHHLAFHVSNREFDAIFNRIKKAKITFGSAPLRATSTVTVPFRIEGSMRDTLPSINPFQPFPLSSGHPESANATATSRLVEPHPIRGRVETRPSSVGPATRRRETK